LTAHQIKAAVRRRDGYRCCECGLTNGKYFQRYGKSLDVHRIVPGSKYTLEGCVTLCQKCHFLRHSDIRAALPPKLTLYANIDADLKDRLDKLADRRGRKLTAEVEIMVRRYLAVEEPKQDQAETDDA
jgi:5-methylcytosine-specific restriction endonuclease McrA